MSILNVRQMQTMDPMFKRNAVKFESFQRLNHNKSRDIKDIVDNVDRTAPSPITYSKKIHVSPLDPIEENCVKFEMKGIKISDYFISNEEISQEFKAIRSYTPIPSRNTAPDLALIPGIIKSEVFIKSAGKVQKIIQYSFDEESRDHRTAIATLMKFNKEHAKKAGYIIKPHNSSPLRVTNPRANDVLLSPIKDNTRGDGTRNNPYQFTKGLNYSEIKDKITSPHVKSLDRNINIAERARSDNGALLLQITSDKTKSIAAYNTKNNEISGPKAMQEVVRTNRFDKIVVNQCRENLTEVISACTKYLTLIEGVNCKKDACDLLNKVLTERRKTPPRISINV